jgi:vacuolar-type H+-ATPase subunit E/Vma4
MTGAPLEPVRAEILRQAHATAAAAVAQAETEAARQVADARTRAEAILDEARARGQADADRALRAEAARARRRARAVELRARREIYESWRETVFQGVRRLKQDPGYPDILAGLAERARDLLGAGARLDRDASGGLRARAAGRGADLTLEAIAARAVEEAQGEASGLWTL